MRTPLYVGIIVLSTASLVASQQPTPPQSAASPAPSTSAVRTPKPQPTVDENVEYGGADGQKLLLDVYEAAGNDAQPHPAVVLIHGGGWTSFDKGTMRGMGQVLARDGFVAFSIDYRLFHDDQNRWPAQLDDAQRAVRWVRANAIKYRVDRDHIGAFGHSAGAQMAALLGMEDTRDNSDSGSDAALAGYSSRVQAVVDVSGPTDFTPNGDSDYNGFLSHFFGADYATHPEIWRDASPVVHVSKSSAPFLIVHGTRDEDVPIAQSEELADRLRAAGVAVNLVKVDDAHTFQTPEARRRLAFETLAFFNRYLRVR
jgi:acetyl esterase/lipase